MDHSPHDEDRETPSTTPGSAPSPREATASRPVHGDFLRLLFHELKTPVTAIKLQLSVLRHDPEVQHTAVLDRGLDRMGRSLSQLLHLVDLVLAWTHAGQGKLVIEPSLIALTDLVDDATSAVGERARLRQVVLHVQPPAGPLRPLRTDRRLVRLVLIDLLERAIALSSGRRVEIGMRQTESGSRILVRDAAPRGSATERAQAFEPQWGGRGRDRAQDRAYGLGLLPARELAQALGGDLRWHDDPGPGNCLELGLGLGLGLGLEPHTTSNPPTPS